MLKKIGLALGILLLVVVVAFGAAFAYAQTGIAKGQISGMIEDQLSGPTQKAEVSGLEGLLPFDIRLGRFSLSDDRGPWLEVDNARVRVSPTDLLAGRIVVHEVGAERVALDHLPPPGPESPPSPPSDEPFTMPSLPESLPVVRVEQLRIDRIEIGEAVAGQSAVFRLGGAAGTGSDGKKVDATLDLVRTDQATADLTLGLGADLAAKSLTLKLAANETGGLLAGITGRPEAGALHLTLDGDGPLADWHATLQAEAEWLATMDAKLALALEGIPGIDLTGTFVAAQGVLPAELAPLVGERLEIAVKGGQKDADLVSLDQLRITGGGFALTGAGQGHLRSNRVDGKINLDLPALDALSGLAGVPLAGSAGAEITASGALMQPDLVLTLAGRQLAADRIALATLDNRLDIGFLGPLDQGYAGARVSGGGGVTGLTLDGAPLRPEDRLDWTLQAEAPAEGEAVLQSFELKGAQLQARANGRIDQKTLAGTAHAELALPDLAALVQALGPMAPAGLSPAGNLALTVDATIEEQAKRVLADILLDGKALAGLPPGAQELVGDTLRLDARADVQPGQRADITSLELKGAGIGLTGRAGLALAGTQALQGELKLALPDLKLLSGVAGQPLAGRVEATTQLAGTLARPDVTLDLTAGDVAAAGQLVRTATLKAKAAGAPDDLAGDVALSLVQDAGQVDLATGYRLVGQKLDLAGLKLTAPGTTLGGDIGVDLATTLATGRLQGGVSDLAALQPWTQQKLAGKVDLQAVLDAAGGKQAATVTLNAAQVAGDFGTVGSANLKAGVTDALGAPAVQAEVVVDGFSQPGLVVEAARVTAAGPLTDLQVTAEAKGAQADKFDVATRARLGLLGERKQVQVQTLAGTYAGQSIRLGAPATLVLDKGVLDLDQLDIRIGKGGRVQGSLELGDGRVRADAALSDFDLAMLQDFGAPALAGTAAAKLSLTGSTAAPEAKLSLRIPDLAPAGGVGGRQVPPVALTLDAGLAGGRLDGKASLAGVTDQPVTASVALPMRLALDPFAFDLPQDGALTGKIDADADLARLAALAQLDGQRVEGRLLAALTLGGSLAAPDVGGRVELSRGLVEDAATGALFRDIGLLVTAADRRIVVERFQARDRRSGTIGAEGELRLDEAAAMPYRFDTTLAGAEVMRNDLGTVQISGGVGLKGDLKRAAVQGKLTVDRADLQIPDGGGVSIPVLPVDEIHDGTRAPVVAKGGGEAFLADLDLAIDIPARLFVRGRGLDSEWGGGLTVKGTSDEPVIEGRIGYRRGFLDLLDRRFKIRSGEIAFDGAALPTINLDAAAEGPDMLGIVKITGPANDPKLELTSEPVLPRDEVLARLLFKRDMAQITPAQGLRLASAVATLEGGGFDALGKLRSGLGLDTLDVGGDSTETANARAGKYVSDNVYVEMQRGIQSGSGKARVEVELTPSLSFNTEVTEKSQTGVGVEWKLDY